KTASTVCKNTPITFTNTSTPVGGTSTWYFGDGASATGTSVSHAYISAGTYTVKLVVNLTGCVDSAMQTITVSPTPNANFTLSNGTGCNIPHTVSFTNTSTGNPTGYLWIFGDGNTSTAT